MHWDTAHMASRHLQDMCDPMDPDQPIRAISWRNAHLTLLHDLGTLYNFAQQESLLCADLIPGHACVQAVGLQEPSQSPARHQQPLCASADFKQLQTDPADAIDSAQRDKPCQV